MYRVSVIMPALNEEANIDRALQNVIDSFKVLGIAGEIVVVNDGSRDGTQAAVERWTRDHPNVRTIRHDKPNGIGASFWHGVLISREEIVTMLPGDGENDACEILRYLPLMEHVDVVIPFAHNPEVRSRARRMLSRAYIQVIGLSFGARLRYYNGTVLYRKAVFEGIKLQSAGFFYQTELLIKAIRAGYLYAEVPYGLRSRAGGKSKAVTLKSLLAVSRAYLATLASIRLRANDEKKPVSPNSVTAIRKMGS